MQTMTWDIRHVLHCARYPWRLMRSTEVEPSREGPLSLDIIVFPSCWLLLATVRIMSCPEI